MNNSIIKIWQVQDNNNQEGIFVQLTNSIELESKIIKKLEEEISKENVNYVKENITSKDLIKIILSSLENNIKKETIPTAEKPSEYLGKAIMQLATAFCENKENVSAKAETIYVAYLMIKDEISLDKIMKYANITKPELEIVKYYLIEKNNF